LDLDYHKTLQRFYLKMSADPTSMSFPRNVEDGHCPTVTEVFHKTVHDEEHKGVLGKVKETVVHAIEKVTGKDKDPEYQLEKEVKHAEHRAHDLQKEGHKILDHTDKDFKKAEKAQAKAEKTAAKANELTEKALNKEIEGQEKLIIAGQKLIEAGTKLQAEAAINQGHQVPYNVHDTAKVRQQTCTTTGAMAAKEGIDTAQEEFVVRQTKPGYAR
jgi:hypothetical protein